MRGTVEAAFMVVDAQVSRDKEAGRTRDTKMNEDASTVAVVLSF